MVLSPPPQSRNGQDSYLVPSENNMFHSPCTIRNRQIRSKYLHKIPGHTKPHKLPTRVIELASFDDIAFRPAV